MCAPAGCTRRRRWLRTTTSAVGPCSSSVSAAPPPSPWRRWARSAPSRRPRRAAANGRLIPPSKVGTITFTQRDVPGRLGHRGQRGLGVSPDHGLPRRRQLPGRPHRPRPAGAVAGRLEGALRVLRQGRHRAGRVRRLRAERRQPRRSRAQPGRRRCRHRGVRGGVPRLRADPARLPGRQRAGGDRQPRLHPEHLGRAGQRRRHHDPARPRPLQTRARVRGDPGHAVPGHRQRPDQREQPQHRAVDARRREVDGAQRDQRQPVRHPHVHRTTTPRRTTSCRTARW